MSATLAATARPPSELRDKAAMLIATAARMAVGLGTFVVLARFLGPVQFGLIATAIAYATFLGIATDFGLATYALRTASAVRAEEIGPIVGEALAVKAVLTVAVALLGAAALALLLSGRDALVYALVFFGTLGASFADLALVAVRARRRFDVEARLVLIASVGWLIVVGGVAAATRSVVPSAIAFALTRIVYLAVVLGAMRPWLAFADLVRPRAAEVIATIRKASAYAVDSVLTTLSGQIDVLLFGLVLTKFDMGIYQAGSRLVQVIAPLATVLSTVSLPHLVQSLAGDSDRHRRISRRMTLEFAGLAIVLGLGFALVAPFGTHLLYGSQYDSLKALWGGFAAFVALRLMASAFGIQLVAFGEIRTRIASSIISMAVFAGATAFFLPRYRLSASSDLLALSAVPSIIILGSVASRRNGDRVFTLGMLGATFTTVALFIFASARSR